MRNYDARFILKADDDAFINVPALIAELKSNCRTPSCRKERIYFGREIRNNVVRPCSLLGVHDMNLPQAGASHN